MRERIALTVVWFCAFVAVLFIVELYVDVPNAAGLRDLLPADRLGAMRPLIVLYGSYLGGIVTFWFAKPFPETRNSIVRNARFLVAVACTTLFNAMILFLVLHQRLFAGGDVLADIGQAVTVAGWSSFLVAPVMLYYFGVKTSASD